MKWKLRLAPKSELSKQASWSFLEMKPNHKTCGHLRLLILFQNCWIENVKWFLFPRRCMTIFHSTLFNIGHSSIKSGNSCFGNSICPRVFMFLGIQIVFMFRNCCAHAKKYYKSTEECQNHMYAVRWLFSKWLSQQSMRLYIYIYKKHWTEHY